MKKIVAAALLALSFTTGFTCSKNTPAPEATTPAVEATPAPEAAPMEGAEAPAAEATPAAEGEATH